MIDYQILALDLDGTLTNSQKQITPPTREALIRIQEAGIKVVLASGRPTTGVLPLARELQLQRFGSYILSFNGGKITDCRSGQTVYNRLLPKDVAKPLFELIKDAPVDIVGYSSRGILSGLQTNEYTKLESTINGLPVIHVDNFPASVEQENNKFLITGNPDDIAMVKKRLIPYFHGLLNIYCSDPFFLEIMPQNIDKAHSLCKLLSSIGLTTEQMVCCGDGCNDITMLETAGLGVAMANAQTAVKEAADYITLSNDEDGVLHVIENFSLFLNNYNLLAGFRRIGTLCSQKQNKIENENSRCNNGKYCKNLLFHFSLLLFLTKRNLIFFQVIFFCEELLEDRLCIAFAFSKSPLLTASFSACFCISSNPSLISSSLICRKILSSSW